MSRATLNDPAARTGLEPFATPNYPWGAPKRRKLGELLASNIESDIVRLGWPVGHVLGAEPELLVKYGVSRAVFREAVRILENHMVATMKRGPGGGLVVTAPDGSAVAGSVALYLEYRGVQRPALYEARCVLELECVRMLARRMTAEQRHRLREILDDEASGPASDVHFSSNAFHLELARLTGNDALYIFVETLTRLSQAHITYGEERFDQVQVDVHKAHAKIVEAIEQGNPELAVKRMRRHLDAVAEFYQPSR